MGLVATARNPATMLERQDTTMGVFECLRCGKTVTGTGYRGAFGASYCCRPCAEGLFCSCRRSTADVKRPNRAPLRRIALGEEREPNSRS